jgi:hypothetical protein
LVSFGHCIVSPSLIYDFLITPLVSFGHCIVQRRTDNAMTKRYQSGNQEGIDQRRTDNTMTKRYQRSNRQEATNQRRTDNTMTKRYQKRNQEGISFDIFWSLYCQSFFDLWLLDNYSFGIF